MEFRMVVTVHVIESQGKPARHRKRLTARGNIEGEMASVLEHKACK